jgi:hypothetical protein
MSKNLTRKGLALGAIAALTTSLFAGAPAQAAGESINLTSAFGTGTKTILGSTFEVASSFVGFSAAPGANVKYFVTGVVAADITDAQSASNADLTTPFSGSASGANTASPLPVGVTVTPVSVSSLGNYSEFRFGLDTSRITATTTVTVTAFVDSVISDGAITTGEIASAPLSITFVKPSEVAAVTTLDAPAVGASTVTAHITLGDINLQQVTAGVVRALVKRNGVSQTTNSSTGTNAVWVKADAALSATVNVSSFADTTTFASTDVLSAKANILDLGTTIGGSPTYTSNGTASSNTSTGSSTYEIGVGEIEAVSTANITGQTLRAKATTFSFKSQVTVAPAAAANYDAPAGIPAKVIISDYTHLGTTTLTLGGKTVSATSTANLEWATTTDAAGLVNFTITADKALDGEYFTVTVQALDKTSGYISVDVDATTGAALSTSNATTYTFDDAIAALASTNLVGNQTIATTKGGSVSFDVTVYDQFGQPWQSTKGYKVAVTNAANPTSGGSVSTSALTSSGKATITYTDTSTTTGTTVLNIVLTEQTTTSSGAYTASIAKFGGSNLANPGSVTVHVLTSTTATVLTGTNASSSPAIEYVTFKSVDTRTGAIAPAVITTAQTLTGKAIAADGGAVAGGLVTVSAKGVLFYDDTSVWSKDTITVRTDANGTYTVKYRSSLAGEQTLTVTSGSVTKTVTSSDFAFSGKAKIAKVVVTGPTAVASGRSATYTVQLADKFGNAIHDTAADLKVAVSYTGPGYFTQDLGAIANTNATGGLTLNLVVGSTDAGSGTLTVKSYGADTLNSQDSEKRDNVVTATALTIGAAPVVAPAVKANVVAKTKAFSVSVSGNASAKNVVVKVAGKTVATLKGSASAKTYTVKATKGSKKVTVYVGGKLLLTKIVSVK